MCGGESATERHWDFHTNKTDIVEFPHDVQSKATGVLPLPEPPTTKPALVSRRWCQPDLPLKPPPASFKHQVICSSFDYHLRPFPQLGFWETGLLKYTLGL